VREDGRKPGARQCRSVSAGRAPFHVDVRVHEKVVWPNLAALAVLSAGAAFVAVRRFKQTLN